MILAVVHILSLERRDLIKKQNIYLFISSWVGGVPQHTCGAEDNLLELVFSVRYVDLGD